MKQKKLQKQRQMKPNHSMLKLSRQSKVTFKRKIQKLTLFGFKKIGKIINLYKPFQKLSRRAKVNQPSQKKK